jgi:hypothetical protein
VANLTDWTENNFLDFLLRGQAWTLPADLHIGLFTVAPTDAGGGTEVTGGSYARVAITRSLANWAGTQSAGSTTASTGTGGQTSNNGTVTFAAPTANWGTVVAIGVFTASSGGNLVFWAPLGTSKTINSGDQAPVISAGQLTLTIA